jgi:hypothetical protein
VRGRAAPLPGHDGCIHGARIRCSAHGAASDSGRWWWRRCLEGREGVFFSVSGDRVRKRRAAGRLRRCCFCAAAAASRQEGGALWSLCRAPRRRQRARRHARRRPRRRPPWHPAPLHSPPPPRRPQTRVPGEDFSSGGYLSSRILTAATLANRPRRTAAQKPASGGGNGGRGDGGDEGSGDGGGSSGGGGGGDESAPRGGRPPRFKFLHGSPRWWRAAEQDWVASGGGDWEQAPAEEQGAAGGGPRGPPALGHPPAKLGAAPPRVVAPALSERHRRERHAQWRSLALQQHAWRLRADALLGQPVKLKRRQEQ